MHSIHFNLYLFALGLPVHLTIRLLRSSTPAFCHPLGFSDSLQPITYLPIDRSPLTNRLGILFDTGDVPPTIREEVSLSLSLLPLHLSYGNTDSDYSLTSNHAGNAGGVDTLKTSPETHSSLNITYSELSASGFESQGETRLTLLNGL